MQEIMNRRDFIKLAGITTATLFAGSSLFNSVLAQPIFDIQGLFSVKELSNHLKIPVYGLRVDSMNVATNRDEEVKIIAQSLNLGFKHLGVHGGESKAGDGIVSSGVPREEVFITLHLDDNGDDLIESFNESLAKLKTTYVDALVLRFPYSSSVDNAVVKHKLDSWETIVKLYKDRQARAIGASDLSSEYLERIIYECEVKPMLNCVENPYIITPRLLELCTYYKIAVCTNAPFVNNLDLVKEKAVLKVVEKYNKTPQQIMARWGLQKGFVTFVNAANIQEIQDLSKIYDFKLDQKSVKAISNLYQTKK